MPDALAALSNFCKEVVPVIAERSDEMPALPTNEISEIKDATEFVDPKTAKRMYELVKQYQIHNSRLRSILEDRTIQREADLTPEQRWYDLVYLNALTSSLYNFARDRNGPDWIRPINAPALIESLDNLCGNTRITPEAEIDRNLREKINSDPDSQTLT